jgi:Ca2+-binding EF-hand superfamily protein
MFDSDKSKGISLEEFLNGIVSFIYSDFDRKVKILFDLFDMDSNSTIEKDEFK